MYSDNRPCEVCGSPVRLRSRRPGEGDDAGDQVGDQVGDEVGDEVGGDTDTRIEADDTVDERVCTNPDCASHGSDRR